MGPPRPLPLGAASSSAFVVHEGWMLCHDSSRGSSYGRLWLALFSDGTIRLLPSFDALSPLREIRLHADTPVLIEHANSEARATLRVGPLRLWEEDWFLTGHDVSRCAAHVCPWRFGAAVSLLSAGRRWRSALLSVRSLQPPASEGSASEASTPEGSEMSTPLRRDSFGKLSFVESSRARVALWPREAKVPVSPVGRPRHDPQFLRSLDNVLDALC